MGCGEYGVGRCNLHGGVSCGVLCSRCSSYGAYMVSVGDWGFRVRGGGFYAGKMCCSS